LTTPYKTHPSGPDLIRASIHLREKFFEEDGSPGFMFSPVMTISVGMTALGGAARRVPLLADNSSPSLRKA
jgi:hypothetical protein